MTRRRLFVVHFPVFGGPHNEVLRSHAALRERGWDTVVVLPDEHGNAAERLRNGGIDVVQTPLHRMRATPHPRPQLELLGNFRSDVGALRKLIRVHDADLVEIAGLVNPHAAVAARLEHVPVVWKILDSRTPPAVRRALFQLVRRLADAVMFDGEALIRLHTRRRSPVVPFFVYYPPVEMGLFTPSAERALQTRRALGIPDRAPVVGTIANVNPQKGIEYFVRAAAAVFHERDDCWFLHVGAHYETHRAYTAAIRDEISRSGVPKDRFVFAGERTDVERYYAAMDVKLITSLPRSEGTTTTAMEAMACGVPVVATDVAAVNEVVDNDATGFLVPARDPARLADATLRLLNDEELRRRMGAEARRRAEERFGVDRYVETHGRAFEAATARRRARTVASRLRTGTGAIGPDSRGTEDVRGLLACPVCRGELSWSAEAALCDRCDKTYAIVEAIPVLVDPDASAGEDGTEKSEQAAYFDQVDGEFEIERPNGTPALYSWIVETKLERGLSALAPLGAGATALTVCGGSGMDAEFLARLGARVVTADISFGAARRARERARRHGIELMSIVADVERLPFRDRAVDLVYVHDGLHHLERPFAGLAEMARVAASAVSVNEPAEAAATALAVRLGAALEEEEAGNRIARLRAGAIARGLEEDGLRVVEAARYGMFYRHEPGLAVRMLSRRPLFPLATGAIRALNAVGGRLGNKLTVQAVRPAEDRRAP